MVAAEGASILPDHPMSPAVEQLVVRRDSVLEFLDIFTGQTQRQVQKLGRQIDNLVEAFIREGDMPEAAVTRFIQANERLETYVQRIEERAPMLNMDPLRLRRLLFIREPIDPNYTYHILELPGFGRVDIHFSREVADYFNQPGHSRDTVFPTIFRGEVGARGQDGLKHMTDAVIRPPDGREWHFYELKRIGTEARVMVMQTEGHLFFFRLIINHHRVEYINRENIPQQFFQSGMYQAWAESQ